MIIFKITLIIILKTIIYVFIQLGSRGGLRDISVGGKCPPFLGIALSHEMTAVRSFFIKCTGLF